MCTPRISISRQRPPQCIAGPVQSRFHRAHIRPHDARDLLQGAAFVLEQDDGFLLQKRRRDHRLSYGRGNVRRRSGIDGRLVRSLKLGTLIAILLEREVACDREQIRPHRSPCRVEPFRRAQQRQEALLRDVLGNVRAPGQAIRETEYGSVILVERSLWSHSRCSPTITASPSPGYAQWGRPLGLPALAKCGLVRGGLFPTSPPPAPARSPAASPYHTPRLL